MKVLFLDIDGVLNSVQSAIYHNRKGTNDDLRFCPIACSNLSYLIERVPNLKLVISSTWRLGGQSYVEKVLKDNSVFLEEETIIGITPHLSKRGEERGYQIQDWLDAHPEVTNHVILDDDTDMLESQKKNFANTNSEVGLMYTDVKKVIDILNAGAFEEDLI